MPDEPMAVVAWRDSTLVDRLDHDDPLGDLPVMLTLGFVIRDDENILTLAMTSGYGGWAEVLSIPRQLVVSCRRLVKEVDV